MWLLARDNTGSCCRWNCYPLELLLLASFAFEWKEPRNCSVTFVVLTVLCYNKVLYIWKITWVLRKQQRWKIERKKWSNNNLDENSETMKRELRPFKLEWNELTTKFTKTLTRTHFSYSFIFVMLKQWSECHNKIKHWIYLAHNFVKLKGPTKLDKCYSYVPVDRCTMPPQPTEKQHWFTIFIVIHVEILNKVGSQFLESTPRKIWSILTLIK